MPGDRRLRGRRHSVATLVVSLLFVSLLILVRGDLLRLRVSGAVEAVTVDVVLPSGSTGKADGVLALRIYAPGGAAKARYASVAPVVVCVPDGEGGGSLDDPIELADDVIRVTFLLPGGGGKGGGRASDGQLDYRGAASIEALRDVALFAAGRLPDIEGRTIGDLLPVVPGSVGLYGAGNGGNLAAAALALHGSQLARVVKYIIQSETPVISQAATGDAGPTVLQCGGSQETLESGNPWYEPYGRGDLSLAIDYSRLQYDPGSAASPLFLDGNGDGLYTTVTDPRRPACRTPDLNDDGLISRDEDRPLFGLRNEAGRVVYSRQATEALAILVDRAPWPSGIATPAEAFAFWDLRESTRFYGKIAGQVPEVETMILASAIDRSPVAVRDNAHLLMAFEGMASSGIRVRLNPSRRYLGEFGTSIASRNDLPEVLPGMTPQTWEDRASYGYPDELERQFVAAAVREMADRARARATDPSIGAGTTPVPLPVPIPGGAHGIGANWSNALQIGGTDGISTGTQSQGLAAGRNNRLHIVWSELTWNNQDIFFATSPNGGVNWTSARDIGQTNASTTWPNIATGPDDAIHVVWVDRRNFGPARIYYSRSSDYGTTFTTPLDISGAVMADAGPPSISVDDRNRVHVAWHIGDPDQPGGNMAQVFYVRSSTGGSSFETPRRLSTGTFHAAYPRFSVEKTSGEVLAVVWRDNRNFPDWDICAAISTDGGERFVERSVMSSPLREWDPEVAVDRTGTLHLVYMTWRTPQSMAMPAAISIDYRRSTDKGASWSVPVSLTQIRSRMPFIMTDNERGRLWAFWKDERDAMPGNNADFKGDLAGRFSTDGGLTWSAPEFATDLGDLDLRFPSPVVGSDGRIHAMWSDRRFGPMREKIFFTTRRWSDL